MIWKNLINSRCPKCNGPLREMVELLGYVCQDPKCNFSISDKKFEEIVNSIYKPSKRFNTPNEEENLRALNEL